MIECFYKVERFTQAKDGLVMQNKFVVSKIRRKVDPETILVLEDAVVQFANGINLQESDRAVHDATYLFLNVHVRNLKVSRTKKDMYVHKFMSIINKRFKVAFDNLRSA